MKHIELSDIQSNNSIADYMIDGLGDLSLSADSVKDALNRIMDATKYELVDAELSSVETSLCCQVKDNSITTIGISSEATPVVIVLPPKAENGGRDFKLRIEVSSSTAPEITFQGLDETIAFDSESDDWYIVKPGVNVISFVETK